jgi:nicotinamide riboside kinase
MTPGRVIAILGAECTGKTTLAAALGQALKQAGGVGTRRVAVVAETLREFCAREGRTPRRDEQPAIAREHTRRIAAAAATHDIVVADTTALMTAVYSDFVFGDRSLYAQALTDHAQVGLTLLTALDLPWQPDGHQRDGEHVRAPVDALVRAALQRGAASYSVISGQGPARLDAALGCARQWLRSPQEPAAARPWVWLCERCGDADCERHLLPRL